MLEKYHVQAMIALKLVARLAALQLNGFEEAQ
jgi:hypothetical protein